LRAPQAQNDHLDAKRFSQPFWSRHDTGIITSEGFNKEKVHQDWTSYHCKYLGVPIPHLAEFKNHECPCKRFAIDDFGDHLNTCTQHAGAMSGAHEHILTALQRLFTKAGYRTDRKHVPHSRGLKKADLLIKDFQLQGVRNVIVDVTCRHEFCSCENQQRNGEPSHLDVNGALDAAVKNRRSSTTTNTTTAQFLLPPGDLRKNQRRLTPPPEESAETSLPHRRWLVVV
jgi:hypothetical protein